MSDTVRQRLTNLIANSQRVNVNSPNMPQPVIIEHHGSLVVRFPLALISLRQEYTYWVYTAAEADRPYDAAAQIEAIGRKFSDALRAFRWARLHGSDPLSVEDLIDLAIDPTLTR